jgi:hypothetical protein
MVLLCQPQETCRLNLIADLLSSIGFTKKRVNFNVMKVLRVITQSSPFEQQQQLVRLNLCELRAIVAAAQHCSTAFKRTRLASSNLLQTVQPLDQQGSCDKCNHRCQPEASLGEKPSTMTASASKLGFFGVTLQQQQQAQPQMQQRLHWTSCSSGAAVGRQLEASAPPSQMASRPPPQQQQQQQQLALACCSLGTSLKVQSSIPSAQVHSAQGQQRQQDHVLQERQQQEQLEDKRAHMPLAIEGGDSLLITQQLQQQQVMLQEKTRTPADIMAELLALLPPVEQPPHAGSCHPHHSEGGSEKSLKTMQLESASSTTGWTAACGTKRPLNTSALYPTLVKKCKNQQQQQPHQQQQQMYPPQQPVPKRMLSSADSQAALPAACCLWQQQQEKQQQEKDKLCNAATPPPAPLQSSVAPQASEAATTHQANTADAAATTSAAAPAPDDVGSMLHQLTQDCISAMRGSTQHTKAGAKAPPPHKVLNKLVARRRELLQQEKKPSQPSQKQQRKAAQRKKREEQDLRRQQHPEQEPDRQLQLLKRHQAGLPLTRGQKRQLAGGSARPAPIKVNWVPGGVYDAARGIAIAGAPMPALQPPPAPVAAVAAAAAAQASVAGQWGISHLLMEKMGFQLGQGLGSSGSGIREPLQAVRNAGRRGLGFGHKHPGNAVPVAGDGSG